MSTFDQIPFEVEFADNPEPRCPCVLLVDTSGSMAGDPIRELNTGLRVLRESLSVDEMALKRVELSLVTFGPIKVRTNFQPVDQWEPPTLEAIGDTPIGGAVERALEILEQRKTMYRENGIAYYRPWVFMITDGSPTDVWEKAAERIQAAEAAKQMVFFCVGVEGADFEVLKKLGTREPLKLRGLQFREMFQWLSNSLCAVSQSQMGEAVPLTNPTAPNGWGVIA